MFGFHHINKLHLSLFCVLDLIKNHAGASLWELLYHDNGPWEDSKGKLFRHQVQTYSNVPSEALTVLFQAHCEAHELWCWKAASRHCRARSCHQGIRESSFPKATPNTPTTTDLEHEDRVGGLLNGGSLAEGHREEPGGGEGGGSQGQPGGSPHPHPRLLSQGCRPLQGQLSQVLMFSLNFALIFSLYFQMKLWISTLRS